MSKLYREAREAFTQATNDLIADGACDESQWRVFDNLDAFLEACRPRSRRRGLTAVRRQAAGLDVLRRKRGAR